MKLSGEAYLIVKPTYRRDWNNNLHPAGLRVSRVVQRKPQPEPGQYVVHIKVQAPKPEWVIPETVIELPSMVPPEGAIEVEMEVPSG